jgi:putative SOS response-associated peptidase YedK
VRAAPTAQVADLHDRMPVVVPEEAWSTWLDPLLDDPAELHGLLQPNEQIELRIVAVSRLVNDVRNGGPELIEPAPPDELALAAAVAADPGLFD